MSKDTIRADGNPASPGSGGLSRRNLLLSGSALAASSLGASMPIQVAQAQQAQPAAPTAQAAPSGRRPNILVIFGDDIGLANVSCYSHGLMDDVFQFVDTFKEFPPRSFPPSFNPANVMGSTLDTIKQRRNLRQSLDPERIRGTLNRMVEQHIEQRSVPAPR